MAKKIRLLCFFIFISGLLSAQNYRLINTEKLYISTDRYFYNPGESLFFSTFLSASESRAIISSKVKVWLENSRHQTIDSVILLTSQKSILGIFKLPMKGGIYYLKGLSAHHLNYLNQNTFTKEIFVQSYVKRDVDLRINLDKKNYESGDSLIANIRLAQPGKKSIPFTNISYELNNGDSTIYAGIVESNMDGKAKVELKLPMFDGSNMGSFYLMAKIRFREMVHSQSEKVITRKRKAVAYLHYGHGNEGYLPKVMNRIIIKTTDKHGNPMDVKARIVNSSNKRSIVFESFNNGLGSVQFIPKVNTKYYLIRDQDTLLELFQANKSAGLTYRNESNRFTAEVIGGIGLSNLYWTATYNGKVILNEAAQTATTYELNTKDMTGVISLQLSDFEGVVAKKLLFLGRDRMQMAKIALKDSVFMLNQLKEIKILHPSERQAQFSMSIVEETNINQIQDKSHNVYSWFYLGSEFKKEIHEPQYYFDDEEEKSKESLELLMHTLIPYWVKDFNNGKVIGNPDFEFTSSIQLKGTY